MLICSRKKLMGQVKFEKLLTRYSLLMVVAVMCGLYDDLYNSVHTVQYKWVLFERFSLSLSLQSLLYIFLQLSIFFFFFLDWVPSRTAKKRQKSLWQEVKTVKWNSSETAAILSFSVVFNKSECYEVEFKQQRPSFSVSARGASIWDYQGFDECRRMRHVYSLCVIFILGVCWLENVISM